MSEEYKIHPLLKAYCDAIIARGEAEKALSFNRRNQYLVIQLRQAERKVESARTKLRQFQGIEEKGE